MWEALIRSGYLINQTESDSISDGNGAIGAQPQLFIGWVESWTILFLRTEPLKLGTCEKAEVSKKLQMGSAKACPLLLDQGADPRAMQHQPHGTFTDESEAVFCQFTGLQSMSLTCNC
jgi:hypothetical protein